MATFLVWSGGDGTSGTEAGGWAAAKQTLAAGLALCSANGDIVKIHYAHAEDIGANTTWTLAYAINIVSVNKDSSDAPTPMGTTGYIGNISSGYTTTLNGAVKAFVSGLTLKVIAAITLNSTDGGHFEFEDCRFHNASTSTNSTMTLGGSSTNQYTKHTRTTAVADRTGSASTFYFGTRIEMYDCTFSYPNGMNSTLNPFQHVSGVACNPQVLMVGCNLTDLVTSTGIVSNNDRSYGQWDFVQCKLPSSWVMMVAQTSVPNRGSNNVFLADCHSGDTHGIFEYHNAFGSITTDSTIKFTSGAAGQSWKIVTTANCSYYTPFETPWIDLYNTGTSAITPYIEILRDGSATAYQNDEVWSVFSAKATSGSTRAAFYSDKCTLANKLAATLADQAAGSGTGSWTGEAGTAWSGKCDSGSAITPAEVGHIRGRIVVGEPSITVYVDPQIRT